MEKKQKITKEIRAESIKRAKLRIKELIKIEVDGNTVTFKVPAFDECYNINIGGGDMSLNQADKKWIKEAIVTGVAEGVKPVVTEMHNMETRLTNKINAVDAKVDAVDAKLDKHIVEGH